MSIECEELDLEDENEFNEREEDWAIESREGRYLWWNVRMFAGRMCEWIKIFV